MSERIHRVLDGELSRDELSREERAILAEFEGMIGAAGRAVPAHVAPDLTAGVMARISALEAAEKATAATGIRESRPNPLARALGWLWTPRPIALRPAWALGAAALVIGLFAAIPEAEVVEAPIASVATGSAPAEIYVHFRLDAPDASSVHLAGDFTEWEPSYELHEIQPGIWTVIVPLEAGVHDYAFVIDGEEWTPDPLATAVDDGFGGRNSRLSLLPPERIQA